MTAFESVDETGAIVYSAAVTAGLLGTTGLPDGGTLAVDLLRPDQPYALCLTATELGEPALRQLADDFAAGVRAGRPPYRPLADHWTRLALVAGIDRWLMSDIDEDVLLADRALAHDQAGHRDQAAVLFGRAATALSRLVDAFSEQHGRWPAAVVNELQEILRAGRRHNALLADAADRLRDLVGHRSAGSRAAPAPAVSQAAALHTVVGGGEAGQPGQFAIDPSRVPARLLGGAPEVVIQAGIWQVRCRPFPGRGIGQPAEHRLLISAIHRPSGDLLATGVLPYLPEEGEFAAVLRLPDTRAGDVYLDIHDALVTGAPRYADSEQWRVALLQRVQVAFTIAREALGLRQLDSPERAVLGFRFAAVTLGAPETASADFAAALHRAAAGTQSSARLPVVVGRSAAVRPLLCELVRLVSRDDEG